MAGNSCARFVHYLLVRHGAGPGDFRLGHARRLYIVLALLEPVPQYESQHGLEGAPGFARKLYQAALLRLSEGWLWHVLCSCGELGSKL